MDKIDRKLLSELQKDATRSFDRIGKIIGISKTAVWNRVQKFVQNGTIVRQAAIIDPVKIGLNETFFVQIKTNQHDDEWLNNFHQTINELDEIIEAYRLAGTIDYLLKVQVASSKHFDVFYKSLIKRISINDVSSSLSMETIKINSELIPPSDDISTS